jgi:hypothetical protein
MDWTDDGDEAFFECALAISGTTRSFSPTLPRIAFLMKARILQRGAKG